MSQQKCVLRVTFAITTLRRNPIALTSQSAFIILLMLKVFLFCFSSASHPYIKSPGHADLSSAWCYLTSTPTSHISQLGTHPRGAAKCSSGENHELGRFLRERFHACVHPLKSLHGFSPWNHNPIPNFQSERRLYISCSRVNYMSQNLTQLCWLSAQFASLQWGTFINH